MNTKKSNLLNWRNKRTAETADPNAKVVLSDDTFVDFSEITTDVELEKVEEEVEQLSEVVTEQGEQLDDVEGAVSAIESKIPTEASSQNQLADKDFVNESVATASADFKGTYETLQELEQVEANANDYGFVIVEDQYGNTLYDRYKYTEGEGWLYEYSVNSVQFSSNQWNAINSGIDDNKVNKLNALPTKSQLDESLDTKANKSEMAVSTNADKTTITLKTGTSAEVVNAHLDISGKVDKEAGKGLSTNDYTNAEKTKLGDLPTNAELLEELDSIMDKLVTDDVPTAGSDNLVKSGGVASAISGAVEALDSTVGSTTVTSGKHVGVKVVEANGVLTSVQIGEDNIADATDLGDISSLDTQIKTDVVSAINELVENDEEFTTRIANVEGALTGNSPIYEFDPTTEYGTDVSQVHYCYKDGLLYKATATHTGAWNASHFEEMNVLEAMRLLSHVMLGPDEIPLFSTTSAYSKDDYTIYEDKLYRFIENHSAGAWNANQVAETNVFNELIRLGEVANEKITVILSTEDGLGTVSGVSVSFTVEGESEPREIFTDAEGKASTIVTKGLLVDIDVAGIQGYETPDEVRVRASLPMRNVYVTYIVDRSAMYEHVRLTFSYADANNANVATSIGVYYKDNDSDANPTLHTINVVNNVAEFDVPRGKEYTIVFPDVDVYRTPATISWTSDHVSRQHTVLYVENNNGLSWILNDGTEVPVNAVTQEDYDNIAGMLVYVSSCRPFIIPRDIPVVQRVWLSSNVGISTMGEFSNHSTALGDTDGEANCQKIADFCSGTSYSSGMVSYARTIQVEINGVLKVGFVAAYAQLWAMKTLYSQIRSYFAVVGLSFPNITSGNWWSSTQSSSTNSVSLQNGNHGSIGKNNSSAFVLPVLTY